MANRFFNQFRFSLEKFPVDLFAKVTIGATGACTLVAASSKGVTSITRNSAGDYTVTLQDTYVKLLGFKAYFQSSTGIPAAPSVGIKAQAVSTTKTVEFVCSTAGGGSATDPGSGETMFLVFTLSNSSAL